MMAKHIGTVDLRIQVVRVNGLSVAEFGLESNGNPVGSLDIEEGARVALIDDFLRSPEAMGALIGLLLGEGPAHTVGARSEAVLATLRGAIPL